METAAGTRLLPPSGEPAPVSITLHSGETVPLLALAGDICRRYAHEFPDEEERHGAVGEAWCLHDNQYLLSWAIDDAEGSGVLQTEVAWLARVLESRGFPLVRLARDLDLAADAVSDHMTAPVAPRVARALTQAAAYVRSHETFVD